MSESPYVRVNTAERERTLAELPQHFGGGRVDSADYSERSARVDTGTSRDAVMPRYPEVVFIEPATPNAPSAAVGPEHAVMPKLAVLSGAIVAAALALTFTSGSWFWLLLLVGVPAVTVRVLRHG